MAPPKSASTLLAKELQEAGCDRKRASERLKADFPSLSKSRISQLLKQFWTDKDLQTDEAMADSSASITKCSKMPMISKNCRSPESKRRNSVEVHRLGKRLKTEQTRLHENAVPVHELLLTSVNAKGKRREFANDLFADGVPKNEAKLKLQERYPKISKSHLYELLEPWKSLASIPSEQNTSDTAALPCCSDTRLSDITNAEATETRLKLEARAMKPFLLHKDVPGDGHCFFHCLNHFSPKGIVQWRSDLAEEFVSNRALYIDYFEGEQSFQTHVRGVLSNAWGDAYDGKAAANILGRPILIFHKDSDQDPVIQLPSQKLLNENPIYLLLDESNAGCEHYSLLLPPQSDTSELSRQDDLTKEHMDFCSMLLRKNSNTTWHMVRSELNERYGLEITKSTSRRLFLNLRLAVETSQSISFLDLKRLYSEEATALLATCPNIGWAKLKSMLEKTHDIIIADGPMKRFFEFLKFGSSKLASRNMLEECYSEFCMNLLHEIPDMTWSLMKEHLKTQHQISAPDSTLKRYHQRLCDEYTRNQNKTRHILFQEEADAALNLCWTSSTWSLDVLRDFCKAKELLPSDVLLSEFYDYINAIKRLNLKDLTATMFDDLCICAENCEIVDLSSMRSHMMTQHSFSLKDPELRALFAAISKKPASRDSEFIALLQNSFNSLEHQSLPLLASEHRAPREANNIVKRLNALKAWQMEMSNFFASGEPTLEPPLDTLNDLISASVLEQNFDFWARILSWRFCSKCGKRWPNPMDHSQSDFNVAIPCRACDMPCEYMEKDRSIISGFPTYRL